MRVCAKRVCVSNNEPEACTQGRTQDLSEGVARFFRNKKIDN